MTKNHPITPPYELVREWHASLDCPDGANAKANYFCTRAARWAWEVADRARALLIQQEPEGPTDEELDALERQHWEATGVVSEALQKEEMFNYRAYARAAIAADRARRPTPQPPADGEVAELVAWLREQEAMAYAIEDIAESRRYARAAYLLQHQHPQPVAVSERLPEPSVKVLAHYFNALGKGRTICAIWVPAKSRSDEGDLDANDFLEYDEDGDKYYWPEGWYEAIENWEELGWAKVYEGEIAYWQPLPQWPASALPTPEAQ